MLYSANVSSVLSDIQHSNIILALSPSFCNILLQYIWFKSNLDQVNSKGLTQSQGLDNLYIHVPTSSLAICFSVLDGSGRSAETCLDMERHTYPQSAAFFSQRTRITPSTYVYTSFVSNLVLAKSVAVCKMPRQTFNYCSITCCTGRILRGHVAIIMKSSPHYVIIESTISGP